MFYFEINKHITIPLQRNLIEMFRISYNLTTTIKVFFTDLASF